MIVLDNFKNHHLMSVLMQEKNRCVKDEVGVHLLHHFMVATYFLCVFAGLCKAAEIISGKGAK